MKAIQTVIGVGALAMALGALAQVSPQARNPVIGKVTSVQGLVTVSDGEEIRDAGVDPRLMAKMRVVTGANSRATLRFADCCEVTLEENESLVLEDGQTCAALWALINPLGQSVAAAGSIPTAPIAIGTGVLAGWIANRPMSNR